MDIGRIYMMYVIRLAYEYGVRVRVRVKSGLGLVGTTLNNIIQTLNGRNSAIFHPIIKFEIALER